MIIGTIEETNANLDIYQTNQLVAISEIVIFGEYKSTLEAQAYMKKKKIMILGTGEMQSNN